MRIIVILFIILSSCGQPQQENVEEKPKEETTFKPKMTRMELRGKAQTIAQDWIEYQKFITQLENFDHSTKAAETLSTHIDALITTVPQDIDTQPLNSRLKVLETRVKSYHALLTHNKFEITEQQKRYDYLIIALDDFKIEMMEKFKDENIDEQLDKKLEELEQGISEPDENTESLMP